MSKDELKQILKENLSVSVSTGKRWFDGMNGCMGYYANVTECKVKFDGEIISATESKTY